MSLDPDVEALIERGDLVAILLARFDLPGKTVGYHTGGRAHTFNGLTYRPNRFLSGGSARGGLGAGVTERQLRFSGIPGRRADDIIAEIESYDYLNAPVILSWLAGVPGTNAVAGVLMSDIYEIKDVLHTRSAADAKGLRALNILVTLEPPGRTARGATHIMRSNEAQRFDNDPADTFFEHTDTTATVPRRFGQLRR